MGKYEDTRLVTFQEDYKPASRVLYKKGVKYTIHYKVVDLLKAKGVKLTFTTFDPKPAEQKARMALAESKKAA